MLVAILLIYLGVINEVGFWYYFICGIILLINIFKYGSALYKAGKESKNDQNT